MIRLSDVKVRLPGQAAADGAPLRKAAWADRGRPAIRVSVRTIRRWRVRWRQGGLKGLVPRYPRRRGRRVSARVVELVGPARRDLSYGASCTRLWLRRVHEVPIAMGTIHGIFRDHLGIPRLRRTRKRVPRPLKLFEKAEPGESVQVGPAPPP